MEDCLEEIGVVVENEDPIGYSRLDFNFHALIYEASGNPFLQEILESIKNKMRPLVPLNKPLLAIGYKEHAKVLEALRSRDPNRAKEALTEHNQSMQFNIRQAMSRGSDRS